MPGEGDTPVVTTEKIENIPLYLIPKTIADQIRKKGAMVFKILVEWKSHHKYTIIIETLDEDAHTVNQDSPAEEEGDGHG
jgi:hypothetical protein